MCYTHTYQWLMPHIRNELIPQVWHSLSMQVNHNSLKWIHLCCDTWVQVRHDSLSACAMTYSMRSGMNLSMRVPWLTLCKVAWRLTRGCTCEITFFKFVTWLIHMCDMTHSIWVLWLIYVIMTPSYVWHDSLQTYEWVMSQVHRRFKTPRPLTQMNESWHTHPGSRV